MKELVDCRRRNQEYASFAIPSHEELDLLGPGDLAKLVFDDLERMWVEITERNGPHFDGILINQPVVLEGLNYGDRVCFHAKHIADIQYADRTSKPMRPVVLPFSGSRTVWSVLDAADDLGVSTRHSDELQQVGQGDKGVAECPYPREREGG